MEVILLRRPKQPSSVRASLWFGWGCSGRLNRIFFHGGSSSLGLPRSTLFSESEAELSGESGLLPSTVQKLGVGLESGSLSSHKATQSLLTVVSGSFPVRGTGHASDSSDKGKICFRLRRKHRLPTELGRCLERHRISGLIPRDLHRWGL